MTMQPDELLIRFAKLFSGHKLAYVEHTPPFKQTGNKVKATRVFYPKHSDGRFKQLDYADYKDHLEGKRGIAVSPLAGSKDGIRNICYFGVIDLDCYDGTFTVENVRKVVTDVALPCVVQASKSNGIHIYFFFKNPENAADVRSILNFIAVALGFKGIIAERCEIFPEKDKTSPNLSGKDPQSKCILLPCFNNKEAAEQLVMEGERVYTTITALNEFKDKTIKQGLPLCIISAINSNSFKPLNNRNDFLFGAGSVLKARYKQEAKDKFYGIASDLIADDFSESEVDTVWESIVNKNYGIHHLCNNVDFSSHFCVKPLKLCSLEGIDKAKPDLMTLDCGHLIKYESYEPSFVWELRKPGTDGPYTLVRFNNFEDLYTQSKALIIIGKHLNYVPPKIKEAAWTEFINDSMAAMDIRKVSHAMDSSNMARYINSVYHCLLEKVMPDYNIPRAVAKNFVYADEEVGMYYVAKSTLAAYLRIKEGLKDDNMLNLVLDHVDYEEDALEGIACLRFPKRGLLAEMDKGAKQFAEVITKPSNLTVNMRFIDADSNAEDTEN